MSLLVDIEKDYGGFHLCSRFETNGGITGLLGASGCGKSQTLRCIAGVQTPDKGRIVLGGVTLYDSERHINLTPQQRGVGYLFQNYALFPNMTVRANILTGLRREKDAAKKQADHQVMGTLMPNRARKMPNGRLTPKSSSRKYPTTVGGSTMGRVSTTSSRPLTSRGSLAT